jgi:predicted DNA-binding transcriptional regulator AlpA
METESMQGNPTDALVRIEKIVGPNGLIPISRSAFYAGIKEGIYPKPVRLGKRTSAWRMSDLMRVVKKEAR